MSSRPFDIICLLVAFVVAILIGGRIDNDPFSLVLLVVGATTLSVLLYARHSLLGILLIGFGGYAGAIGILNSLGSGIPGLQLHDIITIISVVASMLLMVMFLRRFRVSWFRSDLFYLAFLLWTAIRMLDSPDKFDAAKDCIFFASFWTTSVITRLYVSETPRRASSVGSFLIVGATVSFALVLLFTVFGLTSWSSSGLVSPLGKRSLALFLMVVLSASMAQWLHPVSKKQRRIGFVFSVLCGGMILLTLSRTVILLVALVHVPIIFVTRNSRRLTSFASFVRIVAYIALVVFLAHMSLKSDIVQERFFFRGGGMSYVDMLRWRNLNTMGRRNVWPIVWRESKQKPFIGHSTGSVRSFTKRLCGWEHPHCDYLRLFHDQGGVGVVLFCAFWLFKIRRFARARRRYHDSAEIVQASTAALTATLGVVLSFVTDNTLVYTFVMLPVGMLIGAAEAREEAGVEKDDAVEQLGNGDTPVVNAFPDRQLPPLRGGQ